MIPIVTPGRSGSTYVANLISLNLGYQQLEWFSPVSYESYLNRKGESASKAEYLSFVYKVLSGRESGISIKLTPDVCSSEFWGGDILADPGFLSALSCNSRALILLRLDPIATFRSMCYSEITGHWHENDVPSAVGHNNNGAPSDDWLRKRFFEMIDSEIRLLRLVIANVKKCYLFFYEELIADQAEFSARILRVVSAKEPDFEQMLFPENRKIRKSQEHVNVLDNRIRAIVREPECQSMLCNRSRIFLELGVFSLHHSLVPDE